jgi:AraC-like DNA-binding protein
MLIPAFLGRFRELGGDLRGLVERHGCTVDADLFPTQPLKLATWRAVMDDMAQTLNDPLFGIHTALAQNAGPFPFLEALASSAETVKDGLTLLIQYQKPAGGWSEYSLEVLHEEVLLHHRFTDGGPGLGRHGNEYNVASMLLIGCAATADKLRASRVWFAHSRHTHAEAVEAYFGPREVIFDAGENGFALDSQSLDTPLRTANARLLAELKGQPDRPFLESVEQATRTSLQGNKPHIAVVAKALHLSPRTLQRRLAESGTTFQQVVDRVRQTYARLYLRQARLSLDEISYLLGYTRLAAFDRAFKRWTGTTPGQFAKS